MDLASGAVEERLSFEDAAKAFPNGMLTEAGCVAIDPTGAYLAIGRTEQVFFKETRTETTSIYLVDLAGKTIRTLVVDQRDNRDYLFSPDGGHLLFRSFAPECEALTNGILGKAEAYSVCLADTTNDTVKTLKPVPEGKTELWFPEVPAAWSPDSQAVVFQYYRPLADSAAPWELIACEAPDFAPKTLRADRYYSDLFFVDADRLIAGTGGVIDLINVKTGESQRLVSDEGKPLSEKPMWNIRRAGDSVAYRVGQMPNDVPRSVPIPPAASAPAATGP
ncbi:MAG: hypothetical protein NTW86_25075 [Candidatus Sumerlaeota bacterium]|nr:hypothetical protein [Candidatus Sumerlaeota bacterium]